VPCLPAHPEARSTTHTLTYFLTFTLTAHLPADPEARNKTLELVSKPAEGQAAPPLAQQLRGLFSGLKADST